VRSRWEGVEEHGAGRGQRKDTKGGGVGGWGEEEGHDLGSGLIAVVGGIPES
jgi:hypothetical protein